MMSLREVNGFSREQTGRLMRETGGDWNSVTLPDQTGFFETVPSAALDEVLKLEAARMSASGVAGTQFQGQRRRVRAEVQARDDNPKWRLDDEVSAVAFKRHPYRWPSLGWLSDVESISREEVTRHSRENFAPNNAILVLVGDFESRTMLGAVEKYFGAIPRRPDPRRTEVREPEPQGERRVRLVNQGNTPYLQFAFRTPELLNDDFYSMLVLDAVLTGAQGMRHWPRSQPSVAKTTSRLFQALVETELALEVGSSLMPRQAPGLYEVTLTLSDALQFQVAEEAVLEQLERLKNQEVSDFELAKGKNLLVAGEFLAQDTIEKRAVQLGYFESIASYQLLNDFEYRISRVGKEDLRRVAIHYLGENSRTVGSVVPALKQKTIEVETLSPSGSESRSTASSSPQAASPKELTARAPLLQPLLIPESVLAPRVSDKAPVQNEPKSLLQAFAEIPTVHSRAPKLERKVLPNGVTLIVAGNRKSSTVNIQASIKFGTDRDTGAEAGLASLVNMMLRQGVSARSQAPLDAVFDYLGAEVSSQTDSGISTTSVRGLSKDTANFLQLLAEMFQSPSFEAARFDSMREALLGRLRELERDPGWVAERNSRQRFYTAGASSHGMALASVQSVESLKLADVREFYNRCYRPQQLIVSIVGDISPEAALAAGEGAFGNWKGAIGAARPSSPVATASTERNGTLQANATRSALVLAGLASLSVAERDYYPFLILNQILAGVPDGGRLGDRLLATDAAVYGIQGKVLPGTREQLFAVRLMADPSEVEKIIAILREEYGRIKEQGVTEEEIKRAKRSLIHAWAVQMESNDSLAQILRHMEAWTLGIDYLERYPSLIEGVSGESLLDCARTRFAVDPGAVVVVGSVSAK